MQLHLPSGYSARTTLPGHYSLLLDKSDRKNYYTIKDEWGKGETFFRELEPGFALALWKGVMNKNLQFQFACTDGDDDKMIALVFPVESSCVILDKSLNICPLTPTHGKILTINSSYDYVAKVDAGRPIEILEIYLKSSWIKDQYAHDDTGMCGICAELSRNESILTVKAGSLLYFHSIVSGIIHEIMKGRGNSMQLKFRSLELLDFALHQIHSDMPEEKEFENFPIRMKQIISRHLDGRLPAIPQLAREMATSESSLKRKFRKCFGTSIYEYYTAQKMEFAKTLLSEKGLQVTEVAYQLSYEKVSHFIEVFKKYFGDSPGKLKKI